MLRRKYFAALLAASLFWAGRSEAVVTMKLDQYVREILLNNQSLQAGVNRVRLPKSGYVRLSWNSF